MQKWDHLHLVHEWSAGRKTWGWRDGGSQTHNERLKKLGMEGWELVNVVVFGSPNSDISEFHFYFKRPLE